jgi:hypothetical protein
MIAGSVRIALVASAATALMLDASAAHATVTTFTSSALFDAAISGSTATIENYGSGVDGQTIASGDSFDGITYTFAAGPSGTLLGGDITGQFDSFSGLSLGGNQSTGDQFLYGGDSVTATFAAPVTAVGVYFNVNQNSGSYDVAAAGGLASAGSDAYDTDTFVFGGITSTTPFTSVTFSSTDPSLGSFNIPEIESVSAVPLPGALPLFASAFLGLTALGARKRAARVA